MTTAVKMPIKSVRIEFDDIGYEGWYIVMRTNPKAYVYDDFLAVDDEDREWKALSQIIIDWNFVDEEGNPLALPKDGLNRNELPYDLKAAIIRRYIDAFNENIRLPKPLENGSVNISLTGAGSKTNGLA